MEQCNGHRISITYQPIKQGFNFIRCNLSNCLASTRPVPSYLSLVHPKIKYTSCVWDPHEAVHIQALEKVRWRAAGWVLSDYGRQSSITRMLTQLGWPTLQHRCFISRLIFFYIQNHSWKCSPHHPILFFINTVSNDIIASMLLSPVNRPQHNRRGFTPEL